MDNKYDYMNEIISEFYKGHEDSDEALDMQKAGIIHVNFLRLLDFFDVVCNDNEEVKKALDVLGDNMSVKNISMLSLKEKDNWIDTLENVNDSISKMLKSTLVELNELFGEE